MNVDCVDAAGDPRWADLVARRRGGLFHSSAWLGAVRDAYGFDIQAALVTGQAGEAVAGIAFARLDGPPAARLVAAPFCDACDPLFGSSAEWQALLASLSAQRVPIHLRCLDVSLPDAAGAAGPVGATVVKRARWHSIGLLGDRQAQWLALDAAARRAVDKAIRDGVEVRPLDPGPALGAFHRLHVSLRKSKYRLLAQPLSFFEAIARRFGGDGRWHARGAWQQGRLVAGTIFLQWGDTMYYKFNASATDALASRPNDLLVWEGIELARQLGCRQLDLGPSDDDQPGLVRFKRKFGADERELRFMRIDPPGWDDRPAAAARRLLGDMTQLLTRPDVPDAVSVEAGDRLYRYFA